MACFRLSLGTFRQIGIRRLLLESQVQPANKLHFLVI